MNTIKNIKHLFSNLFAILLVVGLIAGCASVTDSNIDARQGDEGVNETEVTTSDEGNDDSEDIWLQCNGDCMSPTVHEPDDATGD